MSWLMKSLKIRFLKNPLKISTIKFSDEPIRWKLDQPHILHYEKAKSNWWTFTALTVFTAANFGLCYFILESSKNKNTKRVKFIDYPDEFKDEDVMMAYEKTENRMNDKKDYALEQKIAWVSLLFRIREYIGLDTELRQLPSLNPHTWEKK